MSHPAYQTAGRPLSKEALYHQRLRQGIFQSPSGAIVGVNSNASDTAALLAASSDLTVKPSYERSIAPEAQNAALAAKKQEINSWKRQHHAPDAQDAATASSSRGHSLSSSSQHTANDSSYTIVRVGIPSALDSASIYKAAEARSAGTMSSRIDPIRDVKRSGIQSKQTASPLNIDKINKLATKNSSKSLNSRFNPDLDYRSGLKKQKPTEFLDQSEEDLAAESADAALTQPIQVPDYATQTRSSTMKTAKEIVTPSLLAAAAARANERLSSMNANTPESFKQQAQLYANALAIAQQKSDERSKNRQSGVINLGGGLTITIAELDKLAATYVKPVLNDIETKADSKRQIEAEKKQRKLELKAAHQKAKQDEHAAKIKEKEDIAKAKEQRVLENENLKKAEAEKLTAHEQSRNKEVEAKQKEYEELEKKHAEEKKQLLAEKKENQDGIDEEESAKKEERNKELKGLQEEKDEILKPTLDELEEENAKLKEVTGERDALVKEVEAAENQKKEYDSKLEELKSKIEKTEKDIEKYTTDLEEATTKHETTDKELSDLKNKHDETKLNTEKEHKDLDSKIEELEKEKKEKTEEKAAKKKTIIAALDNKVRDEHKINQELPPHLKREINEDKIRDTSSLFSEEETKPKVTSPVTESSKSKAATSTATPKADEKEGSETKVAKEKSTSSKPVTRDVVEGKEIKTVPITAEVKDENKKKGVKPVAASSTATTSGANANLSPQKRSVASNAPESPTKKSVPFSKRFSNFFKDQTKASQPAHHTAKPTWNKSTSTKPAATGTTSATKKEEAKSSDKKTEKAATTTTAVKKPETKTKQPTTSNTPVSKDSVKKENKPATATKDSDDYGDFDDEDEDEDLISDKNGNKGGLFKEEIL
ncbi:EIS1 [Candida oxycetoniae]|uniref:EIS1 n=1 Tax=Candida oxycetoniae TaxID=497107 RepID=A0AAI9SWR3_9ASCO|nr:EIS1 [Candida oxycetoniae]KAI3403965.2 EIS1 [Candida oxycetoniae]